VLEEAMVNQHFSSFNNPKQHFEQEAFGSYSLSLSTPFVMSFTRSISSDANLLWFEDRSIIYIKLSNFSNSPQVYVETNNVDDATNAKPSYATHNEVSDVVTILFLHFCNLIICLDIKDFDVCNFDPFNDHVSFDTIVCHQSPCDAKDDVSTSIRDSIPCFDFQLFDYPITFEVCQRSCFLEVDDRELENVNMGSCRSNKHAKI
jgi:hypothetical protein